MDKDIIEQRRKLAQEQKQIKHERAQVNNQVDLTDIKRNIETKKDKSENANSEKTIETARKQYSESSAKRVRKTYDEDDQEDYSYSARRTYRSTSYINITKLINSIVFLILFMYVGAAVLNEIESVILPTENVTENTINTTTYYESTNVVVNDTTIHAFKMMKTIFNIVPILFILYIIGVVLRIFRSNMY